MEPFDVGDAGPDGGLRRPGGRGVLRLAGRRSTAARELVNEHGTLNFNDLNTRDPDGAKAFYGAVFGWELGPRRRRLRDVALPGYGDFLEQRDPGMRERMAEMGAPEGFEDVVGGLSTDHRRPVPADTPPHWGVTFAVDDADAIAERARGARRRGPRRAVRRAVGADDVIRDPQGATFTASKFVPPEQTES